MQEVSQELLTARQVQQLLRVDKSTVYRMASDGRLPAIKVGKQWRFPADEIDQIASQASQAVKRARQLTQAYRDAAILTRSMASFDPKDSTSVDLPVPDYEAAIGRSLKGKTIAIKDNVMVAGVPMMNGASTLEGFVPQMRNKGRLQVGMDADIVVFDPETIADVGTYEEPNQPAVGVQTLLVNGVQVIENGELITDAGPGQAIRR